MKKNFLAAILLMLVWSIALGPAWSAPEIRQTGMYVISGLGVTGDHRLGNTCVVSAGGRTYCGLNASHLSFFADNTVSLELLYYLALAADNGVAGYVLKSNGDNTFYWGVSGDNASNLSSGTLPVARIADNALAYGKLSATGTPGATTYFRGDGSWATPPGTDNASNLLSGTLPAARLPDNAITNAHINSAANISGSKLADNTVDQSKVRFTFTGGTGGYSNFSGSAVKSRWQAYLDNGTELGSIGLNHEGEVWIIGRADVSGTMTTTGDLIMGLLGSDAIKLTVRSGHNVLIEGDNVTVLGSLRTAGEIGRPGSFFTDNGYITGGEISGTTIAGVPDSYYDPTSSIQTQLDAKMDVGGIILPFDNVTGIVPLAQGGTGSDNAAGARTNLGLAIGTNVLAPDGDGSSLTGLTSGQVSGLGTMATQAATAVNIDGGAIDNTPIGATTPAAGTFTNITFDTATSTCVPADNNCGDTSNNAGDPTGANLSAGLRWFNTTSNMSKVRNGDNSATLEVFTSGAAHTLNFATTGTLSGGIPVLDNTSGPTAAQMYGSLNLVNGAITVTLPTAVAGMSGCVMDSGTAHDVIVDVQAGDNVVLVGVEGAAGVGVTNASGSSTGDYICLIAAQANKWYVMGKQGTWASQ